MVIIQVLKYVSQILLQLQIVKKIAKKENLNCNLLFAISQIFLNYNIKGTYTIYSSKPNI